MSKKANRQKRSNTSVSKNDMADLDSENFDPKAYINKFMKQKDVNGLELEKRVVQEGQEKQSADMKQTVADHLTTFIGCKDAIKALQQDTKLLNQEVFKLFKSLQQTVTHQCNICFDPLLENDDTLAKNKKAQIIFDKLQHLLSLPDTIQDNIEQENYTQVVFDFKRSKYFESVTQGQKSGHLFQGLFSQIESSIVILRGDLLSKIRELPTTNTDTSRVQQLLSVLKDLETPQLVSHYCELVEGKVGLLLRQAASALVDIIQQRRLAVSKVQDQLPRKHPSYHLMKPKTSDRDIDLDLSADGTALGSLRSKKASTKKLHISRNQSTVEDDPHCKHMSFHRFNSVANIDADTDMASSLSSELRHISANCAINETLAFIEECGEILTKQLVSFWQVYRRLWMSDDDEIEEGCLPEQVFTKSVAVFESYVWPCIVEIQPSGASTVTLQQWRAALLSIVKPLQHICSSSPESLAASAKDFRDKCQSHFVEQSAGRLSNEIASWANAADWKVAFRVSRKYPSTSLPLWFETAIIDLVTLWTSSDDLRPDSAQFDHLHDRILEAHKEFIDLLHYLAFSQNKGNASGDRKAKEKNPAQKKNFSSALAVFLGESRKATELTDEERYLIVWTDCHALLKLVSKNTFTAFHKMMGDADEDVAELIATSNGQLQLPTQFDSPLTSPRRRPDEATDFQILKDIITSLQAKLVQNIATSRMDSLSTTLYFNGFIRCNINWPFAAEPKRVRSYCHTLLLSLVELYEATVRLTKGFATRDVLTVTMETLMSIFLYSIRHLDFFDASSLCSSNATLQLELELEFLSQCMSGFRTQKSQMYQSLAREHLIQFYVNTNEEAERRRKVRNKVLLDFQRSKVLIDALKHDPTPGD